MSALSGLLGQQIVTVGQYSDQLIDGKIRKSSLLSEVSHLGKKDAYEPAFVWWVLPGPEQTSTINQSD